MRYQVRGGGACLTSLLPERGRADGGLGGIEFKKHDPSIERHGIEDDSEAGTGFMRIGLTDARPDAPLGFGLRFTE